MKPFLCWIYFNITACFPTPEMERLIDWLCHFTAWCSDFMETQNREAYFVLIIANKYSLFVHNASSTWNLIELLFDGYNYSDHNYKLLSTMTAAHINWQSSVLSPVLGSCFLTKSSRLKDQLLQLIKKTRRLCHLFPATQFYSSRVTEYGSGLSRFEGRLLGRGGCSCWTIFSTSLGKTSVGKLDDSIEFII